MESGFSRSVCFELHPGVCVSLLLSDSRVDVYSDTLTCPQPRRVSIAAVSTPADVFLWTLDLTSLAKSLRVEFQGHRVGVC